MKIGVITDCFGFGLPVDSAIKRASALGFDGVQIYATTGAFSPDALDEAARNSYKALLRENNLEVSALCGDMGGHGFQIAADNPARIEMTNRIVDLACELGASVVTTHIGVIPSDKNDPTYAVMLDALTQCGRYAKAHGVTLAIETGPETADVLYSFICDTDGGVGVNLDPANFVMVTGQDPVAAVKLLGKHIVHTHVKDGVMLKKTDPKIIYDHFATGGIEALNVADFFKEVPVGTGDVDFPAYLAALREVGYDGYLTIERETGADPEADIILARDTIKGLIG
ncbi:MAG: sugar phosphate isomerase/epimerase [Clostridia bacterium]|nr:sugar phosphate isomerase/epimerase [Clostridia bacterium]